MASKSWREELRGKIDPALEREVDLFAMDIELRKQGKLEERLFAETRLRRGTYGQRYDNGQRHDGTKVQQIAFPAGSLTKGPTTMWDAPGMQRIKIPMGKLTPTQLEVIADVAEEYSDCILHVTTRQDVQLHFVHIEDTPDIMRRIAAVGITTREACGNSVRNVTACPLAGVCHTETFDVTPYAKALTYFLLGHPDCQDFGRKFKIAFSGCKENPCALVMMHDMGAIARVVDGKRGFEIYVGGGLGAVTHQAKLFDDFLPEEELLPMAQAVCRVFARLGEKRNRQRARVKFLVAKLGIEEFKKLVHEERTKLAPDERWTSFLTDLHTTDDVPEKQPAKLEDGPRPDGFDEWRETNVMGQRQAGYSVATIFLPLGDMTSSQARAVAALARRFTGDNMRLTVEQNVVFRWVPDADLPALYEELRAIGLGQSGAGMIDDVTACPGTDTCKLGISSSRGLASHLSNELVQLVPKDKAVRRLRIKASGCFNSCAQHHISDLGFLGVSRNVGGRRVPHFQVVLGGEFTNNGGAYGLALGAVPSKRVPDVIKRLTDDYVKNRVDAKETFQEYVKRSGKTAIKSLLADLVPVPTYEQDPSFYSDWGDPREYSIADYGEGECAGEVISAAAFGLAAAERETFEAQIKLDSGNAPEAAKLAYGAMVQAARTLLKVRSIEAPDEGAVVEEFRKNLHETKLFSDPFAGDKFAQYFFKLHGEARDAASADAANRWIQEAALFVEAAHSCYERMISGGSSKAAE